MAKKLKPQKNQLQAEEDLNIEEKYELLKKKTIKQLIQEKSCLII